MRTTVIGSIGTVFTAALKVVAVMADVANSLTLAEWASIGAICAGFSTTLFVLFQLAVKVVAMCRKKGGTE